jgi:hypothetical protein
MFHADPMAIYPSSKHRLSLAHLSAPACPPLALFGPPTSYAPCTMISASVDVQPCPFPSYPRAHSDFVASASTLFGTSPCDAWPHDNLLSASTHSGTPNFGLRMQCQPDWGYVTARFSVVPPQHANQLRTVFSTPQSRLHPSLSTCQQDPLCRIVQVKRTS